DDEEALRLETDRVEARPAADAAGPACAARPSDPGQAPADDRAGSGSARPHRQAAARQEGARPSAAGRGSARGHGGRVPEETEAHDEYDSGNRAGLVHARPRAALAYAQIGRTAGK